MELIIDENRFRELKDIGTVKRNKKIKECLYYAQNVDAYGVFEGFLVFLIDNKDNPDYEELYKGGIYTYKGKRQINLGVDKLIASYAMVRYLMDINSTPTAFGVVQKLNQDSNPVPQATIRDMVRQESIDADKILKGLLQYISNHPQLSKEYEKECGYGPSNSTYTNKIYNL